MKADEDLNELLEQAEQALHEMWSAPSGPYRPEHAFMGRFFQLALMLQRDPAARLGPRLQRFLDLCHSELAWAALPLEAYARDLRDTIAEPWHIGPEPGSFVLDNWGEVCRRRSALEFLIEHFPNLPFLDRESALRATLREADEQLQAKVERGEATPHPEQTLKGIPDSHSWWRG